MKETTSFITPGQVLSPTPFQQALAEKYHQDETEVVQALLAAIDLSPEQLSRIEQRATQLVNALRTQSAGRGLDSFLNQYDLSSEEGVALMCLAEALLRIPDAATMDRLISDKIGSADWSTHLGQGESWFVNSASIALMLTGKIVKESDDTEQALTRTLKKLAQRTSEPFIRKAVQKAMKIMGKQFVMGETIEAAIRRGTAEEEKGYRYSFDMLGEAACTAADAEHYYTAYHKAIEAIGAHSQGQGLIEGPSISVKLSALHPRYSYAQRERALDELAPRLLKLAVAAKQQGVALTVDAEEAERLELSLEIFEKVVRDPALAGWGGFGLAIQAYQKRCLCVIDWLAALARDAGQQLCVRLVKGAYWDSEIKFAQEHGLPGYPVFTQKASTDLSYLVCAQKLLTHSDVLYPQFATHNAYTLAAILEMVTPAQAFEFQRLHGMGEPLYQQIVEQAGTSSVVDKPIPCRIYAPVGSHEHLLAYLVRRLLENGANTSFVNRITDATAPISDLVVSPMTQVSRWSSIPHPNIPLPGDIFSAAANDCLRKNSQGCDLSDPLVQQFYQSAMQQAMQQRAVASPLIAGKEQRDGASSPVLNPANTSEVVGDVWMATSQQVEQALGHAEQAFERWQATAVETRAGCLEKMADLLEKNMPALMALAIKEAGKTLANAVGEVREAVDFCRYYAEQARRQIVSEVFVGPTGEHNEMRLCGRGVMLCISPWNFPLAIFLGQVSAALVAGNAVIAKPAEQTPLIAHYAAKLFHQAGIPGEVLQILPGTGETVGQQLVNDPRIAGVLFTGSNETARLINQALAHREGPIVPLIAETGGQNCMIVDSSALPEQVVADVVFSAFDSAGQRCSALRVLWVQEELAPRLLPMLEGAVAELTLGDPALLSTDVGPVIDATAREQLERHAQRMQQEAQLRYQLPVPSTFMKQGHYVAPSIFEITSLQQLPQEVFGPMLHVIRYAQKDLPAVIEAINGTGYGLTFGVHSRIDSKTKKISQAIRAGNVYVNRNTIGATVGVQPFGGFGLSGTGPKAGGPHYLMRLMQEQSLSINTAALGGNASLLALE